jgi:type VI secretion system protein ImpA
VDRLAEGKEEQEMGGTLVAAAEPDWREVRDGCVELFARGKHLKLATILTLAAVRTEGYPGLRDGLQLIRRLLEEHWDQIWPQLDKEDNDDPTERINALSSFGTPIGTYGDKLKLLDRIQEAPICESRQLGRFSMRDVAIAGGTLQIPDDPAKPRPTLELIDAAFKETDAEKLDELVKAIDACTEHATALDKLFTDKIKAGPDFAPLKTLLKDAGVQIRRRMAGGGALPDEAGGGGGGGGGSGGGGGGASLSGDVNSSSDALAALDKIIRYYEAREPSSPVPLIALCAKRMVGKSFAQITKVLTPDAIATLEKIAAPDEAPPGS